MSDLVDDTTPQLGGDLDVGTHRIETTESQMNFEVDSDASSTGYEGYYFYGGPTTNGYNRIWITGTETALQQRVGSSTAYTAFIQNNNQYSVLINEHGGNHPAKITNWGNGSSAHLNIGVRHADAKVRFTDHTGSTLRYAFPNSTPSSGQVLTASDGSGTLSWADASGGDPDLYRDNASSETTPVASGTNAVAIGDTSVASGANSISLGSDTEAKASLSVALGYGATAETNCVGGVAIGYNTTAWSNRSISIGNAYGGTGSQSNYSIAIGYRSKAGVSQYTGQYATALGIEAIAIGRQSVALTDSYASGAGSFAAAIDNNTSSYGATGANSIAIGKFVKATGGYATAIGETTQAQGTNSVCLGYYSQSQGLGTMVMGYDAQSTAVHCTAIGTHTRNAIDGTFKFSGGMHSAAGDAQVGIYPVLCETTDATATTFVTYHSNTITPQTDNQIVLPNNSAYAFSGTIVARQKASEGTACAAWKIEGLIRREGSAGTTVLVNSAKTILDNTPSWDVTLSADTTNGCLKIQGTGAASTNIRWSSTITTSELTYA